MRANRATTRPRRTTGREAPAPAAARPEYPSPSVRRLAQDTYADILPRAQVRGSADVGFVGRRQLAVAERDQLRARVVGHDDPPAVRALGELARQVLVQRMHLSGPPTSVCLLLCKPACIAKRAM
jgi:hypothetical protein